MSDPRFADEASHMEKLSIVKMRHRSEVIGMRYDSEPLRGTCQLAMSCMGAFSASTKVNFGVTSNPPARKTKGM